MTNTLCPKLLSAWLLGELMQLLCEHQQVYGEHVSISDVTETRAEITVWALISDWKRNDKLLWVQKSGVRILLFCWPSGVSPASPHASVPSLWDWSSCQERSGVVPLAFLPFSPPKSHLPSPNWGVWVVACSQRWAACSCTTQRVPAGDGQRSSPRAALHSSPSSCRFPACWLHAGRSRGARKGQDYFAVALPSEEQHRQVIFKQTYFKLGAKLVTSCPPHPYPVLRCIRE